MTDELLYLFWTASSIGFIHTILGPDHYIPFIVMSKARNWSSTKTIFVTMLCGLGHVLGSIVLGFIGVFLGIVIFKLESLESFRGDLAGWLLLAFGFVYFLWGIRHAFRKKNHEHLHHHDRGEIHSHSHDHLGHHSHVHTSEDKSSLTPWVLFTIFVLGPCEPLIPLIMYPAAKSNVFAVAGVALVFGLTTILTMLACVMAGFYGFSKVSFPQLEKYSHSLAGFAIFLCGVAIKFLGL